LIGDIVAGIIADIVHSNLEHKKVTLQ